MSYANIIFARINSFAQATIRNSRVLLRKKASLPVPLVISFADCNDIEVKKTPIKFTEQPLSHKHLIQQACVVSVNSATQLLTQTLVAVIDTGDEYRKAMEELLLLLDESLEQTMYGANQSDLNDLLVGARSRADELKKSLMQLNSLMEYVEKYVSSTADAAFMAGAETVCNAMIDRLHAALQELSVDREKIKKLEEDCLKLQKSLVESEEKKKNEVKNKR